MTVAPACGFAIWVFRAIQVIQIAKPQAEATVSAESGTAIQ